MTKDEKIRIGIPGGASTGRYARLLDALALMYPVEFCALPARDYTGFAGLLFLDGEIEAAVSAAGKGLVTFVAAAGAENPSGTVASDEVRFGNSVDLDACLRGRSMWESAGGHCSAVETETEDEVLASKGGIPIWVKRRRGKGWCQITGVAPPVIGEKDFLFQHMHGKTFMGLVPVLEFLGRLVKDVAWKGPPPRACFIFDDPSLHWGSYGFLNFRELAEHAIRHDYYVSIATIPIDTWWVSHTVAEILRNHSPRVSLLMHGNNHTWCELLKDRRRDLLLESCAQALARADRLAKRHNLPILRIMEPPHGVIANQAFDELLALGYDAALCTTEHLVRYNRDISWPAAVGMGRTEVFGGGLPVLPRIRMSAEWANDIILAAFLRQPIIIAGHHQDAAKGLGFLERMSRLVNSLGDVRWSDLAKTLECNFLEKIEGKVHSVRMLSRKVKVAVRAGVQGLRIERPWVPDGAVEPLTVRSNGERKTLREAGRWVSLEQSVEGEIELLSERITRLDYTDVKLLSAGFWPLPRKIMMEIRDRLLPISRDLPGLHFGG